MLVPVYDIQNCGPRHRFVANGKLVHNSDKVNLQNLPRRSAEKKSPLKQALRAPPGYVVIDSDSSQIEARTLAWWAEQDDLTEAFANGDDVYKQMANKIYSKPEAEISKIERHVGKTTVLGAGYGVGGVKLKATLKTSAIPVEVSEDEAKGIISTYRETYSCIPQLWAEGDAVLEAILEDKTTTFGRAGVLTVLGSDGILLPNGMRITYPNLRKEKDDDGREGFVYDGKRGKQTVKKYIWGGGVVENCIAEGTEVLTDSGWKAIELVRETDRVHDGIEFVICGGAVLKSVQRCVTVDGVYMTPDHKVLTDDGWREAQECTRLFRPNLRGVDRSIPRPHRWAAVVLAAALSVRRALRAENKRGGAYRAFWRLPQLRVYARSAGAPPCDPRYEQAPRVRGVAQYAGPLPPPYPSVMGQLWGAWDNCMPRMASGVRELLGRYGTYLPAGAGLGSPEQRRTIQQGELPLGNPARKLHEQTQHGAPGGRVRAEPGDWDRGKHAVLPASPRVERGGVATRAAPVKQTYDILNAGPRHRFVVRGAGGPFIVHNCCQALARIIIGEQMLMISRRYRVAMTVHDSIVPVVPEEQKEEAQAFVKTCMKVRPKWCPDLPLNCEAGSGESYGDC